MGQRSGWDEVEMKWIGIVIFTESPQKTDKLMELEETKKGYRLVRMKRNIKQIYTKKGG